MIPADFYVFVEEISKSNLVLTEKGDVEGVLTKIGKRCHEQEVPIYDNGNFSFGQIAEGDKIKYRAESVFWTFEYQDKLINCLSIKDIKCCFHH